MSFYSLLFLFVFLPVTLAVYWYLRKKGHTAASLLFLTGASLFYYGTLSPGGLFLFMGSLLFNYGVLTFFWKRKSRAVLYAGIAADICLLALFKYTALAELVKTPGISFYTFCEIALLCECGRGTVTALSSEHYAFWMTFFPKLSQGPILRPQDYLQQEEGKQSLSFEEIYRLLTLFVLGLFKKVILADTLGAAVDYGYSNLNVLHTGEALVVMLSYSLQLYFDFSGYCDMAEALAGAFGFVLPQNFNSPYKARNIVTFWERWHISLTTFFTRYLYIPLGGSRKGKWRTCFHILLVFFVSGLWHGKGMTFLVWGMLHGVLYVIVRMLSEQKGAAKKTERTTLRMRFGVVLTFCYVSIAWVFFRAPDLRAACSILKSIGELWFPRFNTGLAKCFQLSELWYPMKLLHLDRLSVGWYLPMLLFLIGTTMLVFFGERSSDYAKRCRIGLANTLLVAFLFLWCALSFEGVATYLYTNF